MFVPQPEDSKTMIKIMNVNLLMARTSTNVILTSAEKAYLSYIGNEDVSAVISIPPEEFQKIDTVEDFSKNVTVEKRNTNGT
jgi:hypothetical protein